MIPVSVVLYPLLWKKCQHFPHFFSSSVRIVLMLPNLYFCTTSYEEKSLENTILILQWENSEITKTAVLAEVIRRFDGVVRRFDGVARQFD